MGKDRNFSIKPTKKLPWWLRWAFFYLFFRLVRFLWRLPWRQIRQNLPHFFRAEAKEVKELCAGEEDWGQYCRDSKNILVEYFIPHQSNDYQPRILRRRSLTVIGLLAILVKVAVVGYLFFIYPNPGKMAEEMARQIIDLVNQSRIEHQLKPLKPNTALASAAQAKLNDMLANQYFAHQSPNGRMPWDWIDRKQYPYYYAGENLAMHFSSAWIAHQALMLSPTHKKNILNPRYQDIGVAVESGYLDGRQTNVLVQMFGSLQPLVSASSQSPSKVATTSAVAATTPPTGEHPTAAGLQHKVDLQPNFSLAPDGTLLPANLDASQLNGQLAYYPIEQSRKLPGWGLLVLYSRYVLAAIFIFLLAALLVNIFVKVTIQHKPIIFDTILVLALTAGLFYSRLHFLESVTDYIQQGVALL